MGFCPVTSSRKRKKSRERFLLNSIERKRKDSILLEREDTQ